MLTPNYKAILTITWAINMIGKSLASMVQYQDAIITVALLVFIILDSKNKPISTSDEKIKILESKVNALTLGAGFSMRGRNDKN